MKKLYVKVMLLGLVITVAEANAEDQRTMGVYKSENRSFYSIIERSSSTGEGIDKEVFQQTSESITQKRRMKMDADLTPQNASLLAPHQNSWLNNAPRGEYFDDRMSPQKEHYRVPSDSTDREFQSIKTQISKAAFDMNSTPFYKKEQTNDQKALQNQLASMSKLLKEEEKKITRELDSFSKEFATTSKKMDLNPRANDDSIASQLSKSSRLANRRYETPDDYLNQQLNISSRAMQRANTFYPDTLGSKDMSRLIRASESLDNGKRKSLNELINELFTSRPKSVVTPAKISGGKLPSVAKSGQH